MQKTLITFLTLAVVGVAIASLALYTQFVSMDLKRYTLMEYLQKDVSMFVWWQAIAVPFVVGVGYVAIAIAGIRRKPGPRKVALILLGCFSLSILLCFANVGLGMMASISLLAISFSPVYAALRQLRENRPGTT